MGAIEKITSSTRKVYIFFFVEIFIQIIEEVEKDIDSK